MNNYRIGTWRAAVAAAIWLLAFLPPPPVAAQQAVGRDVGPVLATRAQLRDGLARLERDSRSRGEVTLVRSRLETGDFQEGDRILVHVEGEQQLSDTFTVGFGPELRFPQLGAVSLAGVLRSELQSHLTTFLAHYIQDPVVQARPLIRVLVEGNVARPGFYAVPPQLPLADIISVAGGLAPQGKVSGMLGFVNWIASALMHPLVGRDLAYWVKILSVDPIVLTAPLLPRGRARTRRTGAHPDHVRSVGRS